MLKNKTLAILGFGSQGDAHALNLKDSGCKVIIGLYPNRKVVSSQRSWLRVLDTAEAVKHADVIMVAIPDTKQPAAYKGHRSQSHQGQDALVQSRVSNPFQNDQASQDVNVIMVAPKDLGTLFAASLSRVKAFPR